MRTDRIDRMRSLITILATRRRLLWGLFDIQQAEFFSGYGERWENRRVFRQPESITLALRRLEEANRYLLTGERSKHIVYGHASGW